MSDMDFEYADLLLHVVEGVSKVAPSLTHLSSAAMAELMAMNNALKDEAAAESKAKAEGAAVARAAELRAKEKPEAEESEESEETDPSTRRI